MVLRDWLSTRTPFTPAPRVPLGWRRTCVTRVENDVNTLGMATTDQIDIDKITTHVISRKKSITVPRPAWSRSEYPSLPCNSTRSPKPSTPPPPPPHYPPPQRPTHHEYLSQRIHCAERWADTSGPVRDLSSYHHSLPAILCPSYILPRRPTDGQDDAVYYDPRAHQRSSPAIRHTPSLGGQPASATMLWTQIICVGQPAIHSHLRLLYQRLQQGILRT